MAMMMLRRCGQGTGPVPNVGAEFVATTIERGIIEHSQSRRDHEARVNISQKTSATPYLPPSLHLHMEISCARRRYVIRAEGGEQKMLLLQPRIGRLMRREKWCYCIEINYDL